MEFATQRMTRRKSAKSTVVAGLTISPTLSPRASAYLESPRMVRTTRPQTASLLIFSTSKQGRRISVSLSAWGGGAWRPTATAAPSALEGWRLMETVPMLLRLRSLMYSECLLVISTLGGSSMMSAFALKTSRKSRTSVGEKCVCIIACISRSTCSFSPSSATLRRAWSNTGSRMKRLSSSKAQAPWQPAARAVLPAISAHSRTSARCSLLFIGVPKLASNHGQCSCTLKPRSLPAVISSKTRVMILTCSSVKPARFLFARAYSWRHMSMPATSVSKLEAFPSNFPQASKSRGKSTWRCLWKALPRSSAERGSASSGNFRLEKTWRSDRSSSSRKRRMACRKCGRSKDPELPKSSSLKKCARTSTLGLKPTQRKSCSSL
mmetsp:Transcript_26569/g.88078  ORF Transcript_26569/g.88078 Transcript_26569/m.88078 type:complete len:379 (-) Transcript_26569:871-2007(-)